MPKLKPTDVDFDIDELEEAEYNEDFQPYGGGIPPNKTILTAYVKSMWWTRTQADDPMLKILVVAEGNEDDEEEFNGLPIWENMALTKGAKFKWKPFLDHFGLSLKTLKTSIVVAPDDDQFGAPIQKIGKWQPGEESDAAWCRILTGRDRYNEEWRATIAKWLELEEVEDVEDEEDEEDVEDEEEEPAPPARTRRTAAKTTKATTKAPSKPARPAAKTPTRGARTAKPATRSAKPAATKPAVRGTRGKRQAAGYDDDPPF